MIENTALSLIINRENILNALSRISGVVERRSAIDVLSCVRIKAHNGVVTLAATDLDISIVASIKAQISTAGEVKVSAHTLHDIIRKLPSGLDVEFKLSSNNKLSIMCSSANFSIPVVVSEKLPFVEGSDFIFNFKLPASDFSSMLVKTKFAMSSDDTRYNLNGIYLHVQGEELYCVATDSHRLSHIKSKPECINGEFGVIVPRKAVLEVLKILDEKHELVVNLSQKKIQFICAEYVLTSKLVDGVFPDYNAIMPSAQGKSMLVESSKLAEAIDRVSVVILDKVKAIKFFLKDKELTLQVTSSDCSNAVETLTVEYKGDNLEMGFNSRYLLEVLSCIKGMCELIFYEGNSAVLIKDIDLANVLYVVMPMRI